MSDIQIKQTGEPRILHSSDGGFTVSIPIHIKRRAGCKRITLPNGEAVTRSPAVGPTTSLQSALLRGFRWAEQLDSGEVESLREISRRESIDNSYVSRMVNVSMLSPVIIQAILDDTLPGDITVFDLAVDPHPLWETQWEIVSPISP